MTSRIRSLRLPGTALLLAALLVAAMGAGAATGAGSSQKTVQVTRYAFNPAAATVNVGDTVVWHNADNRNHQVVANQGSFVSPVLQPNQSFSFTFQAASVYNYHDGLYPAHKGKLTVKGPPPTVSLALSTALVNYGSATTLSGKIIPAAQGQSVTLKQTLCGQSSATDLTTVTTAADGSFSFAVTPSTGTSYLAQWGKVQSQSVAVQVQPVLRFLPFNSRFTRFYAKVVTADPGYFYGKFVSLQVRSAFGDWLGISRLNLGPLSGRIFNRPRPKGTHVYRIYLGQADAGPCFVAANSGTQKISNRH